MGGASKHALERGGVGANRHPKKVAGPPLQPYPSRRTLLVQLVYLMTLETLRSSDPGFKQIRGISEEHGGLDFQL